MWSGHILPVSTKSLPNTSNRIGQGTKHTQPQSHWSVVWSATICKYIWWGSSSNKELERREWGVHPIQDSFLARLNHCKDHTCTPCHNHDPMFYIRFSNFDRTMGFYWSYILLLKPPVLMHSWYYWLQICLCHNDCKWSTGCPFGQLQGTQTRGGLVTIAFST